MARLPQTGSAAASLYERSPITDAVVERGLADPREYVTTLVDAIAGLGLAALSPDDEQRVRDDLQAIIGCGLQQLDASPTHNPGAKLQISDLQKTLRRVAKALDAVAAGRLDSAELNAIEQTLRGRETGIHHVHDIAAANEIMTALAGMVGDLGKADAMISDFPNHSREIAKACRIAVERLGDIKGKDGHPRIGWYAGFVDVLKSIAAKNNIKPTISISPWTHKARGRFLDLATAIEQLLPLAMRSSTNEARAQRLKRALHTRYHSDPAKNFDF
jgi:hypothetical protein